MFGFNILLVLLVNYLFKESASHAPVQVDEMDHGFFFFFFCGA